MGKTISILTASAYLALFGVSMTSGAPPDAVQEAPAKTHALTAKQKSAMDAIQVAAEEKSRPIAEHFAAVVKRIYENMLAAHPDDGLGISLSDDMKNATWELLSIKG